MVKQAIGRADAIGPLNQFLLHDAINDFQLSTLR